MKSATGSVTDDAVVTTRTSQELVRINTKVQLAEPVGLSGSRDSAASPFVALTASLFFRDGAPRVLAFVSCRSREGVSSVSHSYGEFLKQVGAHVIVLGAADCLVRSASQASVPAGAFGVGLIPSEAFLSAKHEADVLLIDCSSLETSPAVFMLASHVDGILLVVEDGRHSAREIQRAVKLIKGANGIILGVILNKRRQFLPQWLSTLFSRMTR